MSLLEELLGRYQSLPAKDQDVLRQTAIEATKALRWVPNPGPQTQAYQGEADETLYGGEAGGGKTDLLCGLALTSHRRSLLLRRYNKDAVKIVSRMTEIVGSRDGYNGQAQSWRIDGRQVDFGGCEYDDDKQRYKGDPHDLIGFDEVVDFLETQYTFIIAWNRSVNVNQRCRVVAATNPPLRAEGQWVIKRWRAWLDAHHPNPAEPGELRWYTTIDGVDTEVDGPGPHLIDGKPEQARSRTFIPASLSDNPDLARTNYRAVLAGLTDEERRAYKDGDWSVGQKDDDFQVIPTAWIEAAQQRWSSSIPKGHGMTAMAVDVAPSGGDQMVIMWRYGGWFAPCVAQKQPDKDGNVVAGIVVQHRRDNCPVVVDLGGGWGGDALIRLKDNGIYVQAFNGVVASNATTRDGRLRFRNKRAEATWKFREALDPTQEGGSVVALPPDPELKADLASYRWQQTVGGILIEDKEKIKDRIGRSPDKGDAAIMCLSEGERAVLRQWRAKQAGNVLPIRANVGYAKLKGNR